MVLHFIVEWKSLLPSIHVVMADARNFFIQLSVTQGSEPTCSLIAFNGNLNISIGVPTGYANPVQVGRVSHASIVRRWQRWGLWSLQFIQQPNKSINHYGLIDCSKWYTIMKFSSGQKPDRYGFLPREPNWQWWANFVPVGDKLMTWLKPGNVSKLSKEQGCSHQNQLICVIENGSKNCNKSYMSSNKK